MKIMICLFMVNWLVGICITNFSGPTIDKVSAFLGNVPLWDSLTKRGKFLVAYLPILNLVMLYFSIHLYFIYKRVN